MRSADREDVGSKKLGKESFSLRMSSQEKDAYAATPGREKASSGWPDWFAQEPFHGIVDAANLPCIEGGRKSLRPFSAPADALSATPREPYHHQRS